MLPNLKFLIGGILFCVLLFAVAGAGGMLPDSRTHIGEAPVVGRPMMQRSMADVPAQAQVYRMTAARRSDELELLREAAPVEIVPAQSDLPNYPPKLDLSEQDLPKPDVVATADGAKAVSRLPDGSPAEGVVTSVEAAPASPAETRHDEQTSMAGDADPPQQVAVLAVGESEPIPRIVNVPLPTPRPATLDSLRRQRILHRRRQQHDTVNPGVAARQAAPVTGTATGYTPSDATSR